MPLIPVELQRHGPDGDTTPPPPAGDTTPPPPDPFAAIPKDVLEARDARIRSETYQQQYPHLKGRVIGETGAENEEQLKAAVKFFKEHGGKPPEKPKKPDDQPSPEALQLKQMYDETQAKLENTNKAYSQKILSSGLLTAYIEKGGLPNNGDAKTADQAVMLMLNEGIFEVDDQFNIRTKDGNPVNTSVELWLKRNSHYIKPVQQQQVPPAPTRMGVTVTPAKGNMAAEFNRWATGQ